jgi:hypothetical protein
VRVVAVVTTFLVVGLASQERKRAIGEKTAASGMVTDLFAASVSVSAAVVFGDTEGVGAVLAQLQRTEDVVRGAAFSPTFALPLLRRRRGAGYGHALHALRWFAIDVVTVEAR